MPMPERSDFTGVIGGMAMDMFQAPKEMLKCSPGREQPVFELT